MTDPQRSWRLSERLLLMAVIIFAVFGVFRLLSKPAETPKPARQAVTSPAAASQPQVESEHPPSPARAEVLARIRACSGSEIDALVDNLSGAEALTLYQRTTVTDRQQVFAALPVASVARKAKELLGVPESCFQHGGQPGVLAAFLVEAAMGTPGLPAALQSQTLSFSTELTEQNAPRQPRGAFRPDERTIYACLDAGPEPLGEAGVLVRWVNEDSGDLIYLHYLPLNLNQRWNYVFFAAATDWKPGAYRVSCYHLGAASGVLAEGRYRVDAAAGVGN